MTRAIAQVRLERKGALPADAIVNTWHFEGDESGTSTDSFDSFSPGLRTRLITFYKSFGANWSNALSGNGKVTLYNWEHGSPRAPQSEESFTFTPGQSALPSEVALCLSFRGAKTSGANMARRRGRVYLGPWAASSDVTGTTPTVSGDNRPGTGLRTAILTAAGAMVTGGSGTFRLAIYSPTTQATGGSADDAWTDATHMWVDDAWDIQRRRGSAPTSRLEAAIS